MVSGVVVIEVSVLEDRLLLLLQKTLKYYVKLSGVTSKLLFTLV